MTVPTLSAFKIIGNALSRNSGRAELALLAAERHGNVVRLPVPGKRVFLITHPDDLRRVLVVNNSNYKKSFDYQILARLLGQGLLTSEGEVWLSDRRLQQPLFQGALLEKFHAVSARCAGEMVASWKPGGEIQLDAEMTRYGMHVIGERILSLDVRELSDEITGHLDICQRQIVARAMALVDVAKFMWTPAEARFRRSLAVLHRIVDGFIERRAAMPGDTYDLYTILSARPDYPRERLRDQFLTWFMAGHETTAVALTWLFHCLARHPEVEARVREEARREIAGDVPTRAETARLSYIQQVIDESLRLYPPVGFMGREALADDVLSGHTIPKGAVIVLCPYATHRRSDLWPEPEAFDPSRFDPERKERPVFSYIPFGAGPRGCIGTSFAMMELLTLVGAVAKRMRLVAVDDDRPLRPIPLVSMRPSRPVRMRVEAGAS